MLSTVKTLCALSGPSGCENEVRDYILQRIMPCCDEISTDPLGNIIAFVKGRKSASKKIMFAAHMDEVGLIITNIDSEGFLKFGCIGGIDRRVLLGKKVLVGENKLPGVIGLKPVHLCKKSGTTDVPDVESLYIDAGFYDKDDALSKVALGDYCIFSDNVYEMGDFIKAKAIDDRVGCAAMIKLIENGPEYDSYYAFTVQEEVGCRGASAAAEMICPDFAIVLEGTTATDIPSLAEEKFICSAGGGLVVPFMDGGTIYDRELYTAIRALADENGIRTQTKHRIAGGTDASRIQRTGNGIRTAAISCAVRNIHAGASVAAIEEIENLPVLAAIVLEKLAN